MPERYYNGPVSDHFDGLRFYHRDSKLADKGLLEVLRWTVSRKPPPWPDHLPSITGLKPAPAVQGLCVTHIGHATTLLQVAGVNILIDPSTRNVQARSHGPGRSERTHPPWLSPTCRPSTWS